MDSLFDFFSVALFIATASVFFLRFRHENPPLMPYMIISFSCAMGNWLGEHGAGMAAMALLAAGAFLLLHVTSEPYREDGTAISPENLPGE